MFPKELTAIEFEDPDVGQPRQERRAAGVGPSRQSPWRFDIPVPEVADQRIGHVEPAPVRGQGDAVRVVERKTDAPDRRPVRSRVVQRAVLSAVG